MRTQKILVATDVDRTILTQAEKKEKYDFNRGIGHELIRLVENGFYVAFITSNSMEQVTKRLLRFLVEELCHTDQLSLIGNFHFFCNAGGIYFHFDEQHAKIKNLIEQNEQHEPQSFIREVMDTLTYSFAKDGSLQVLPEFIDIGYLKKTSIPKEDVKIIKQILDEHAAVYFSEINENRAELNNIYDLTKMTTDKKADGPFIQPSVEERPIYYMDNGNPRTDTVQLTLKPILSYRSGRDDNEKNNLFGNDCRISLVKKIQNEFDKKGLVKYVARPGGNTSIDVSLAKLDKAYALEFIIDRLNLQGQERLGQLFGSNTVYFGDEVTVGGDNDYPVTRIPGLLTFAVNHDTTTVPQRSDVLVPSIITHEVKATESVMRNLNNAAEELNNNINNNNSALDVFKEKLFKNRIKQKLDTINNLQAHNWQTLHALVSLMCREDEASKRWLEILVDELDSIMIHLGDRARQPAYGASHPPDA